MIDRRVFLKGTGAAGLAVAVGTVGLSHANASTKGQAAKVNPAGSSPGVGHVKSVTAVTQVFGIGQKLTAVVVEFDTAIDGSRLALTTFTVADRTVTKVYANRHDNVGTPGGDGRFVVIELSPDDDAALLWVSLPMTGPGGPPQVGDNTPGHKIVPASATVTQVGPVFTTSGRRFTADGTALISGKTRNLLVDEFEQFSYTDPATGRTLTYNLFTPRDYNPRRKYPLVLFMHDAGVVAVPTLGPLVQGTGAVVWASHEDQAKNPCFVLAPEYPEVVIGDDYEPSTYFDATVNLLKEVISTHNVDPKRVYSTGQSMGGMLTLGINIRYPGILAASYVVAGQWPDDQAAPLVDDKLWVTVSEGDTKAFPMENAIMTVIEDAGKKVAQAQWDARDTQAQFRAAVRALEAQHAPVNYAHFTPGTLPGTQPGGTGNEHTSTWQVAYDIPGIREWIMKQSR